MQLTRTHRILIGVVVAGAVVIAAIGFAGSYAAVRDLAEKKGFGEFSKVFPIGIDAGIVVLLALDLLLTWIRIPFPLLRQTAWLLTAATIAFNGAAAWPDPLGVGMHAVIPVLFVVAVEAARHAVGRIADITADRHMESVRIARWLLAPVPTFRLWRRMKLWELRSYDEVIKLEQDRLVYRARLRARYGRAWKRKAPVESLMPLRLARYGVPLADTADAGLAAAGIEPPILRPALTTGPAAGEAVPELTAAGPARTAAAGTEPAAGADAGTAGGPGAGPDGGAATSAGAGPDGGAAAGAGTGPDGGAGAGPAAGARAVDRASAPQALPPAHPADDGTDGGRTNAGGHPADPHPGLLPASGPAETHAAPGPAAQEPAAQAHPAGGGAAAAGGNPAAAAQVAGSTVTVPAGPNRVRRLGGQGTGNQLPYAPGPWEAGAPDGVPDQAHRAAPEEHGPEAGRRDGGPALPVATEAGGPVPGGVPATEAGPDLAREADGPAGGPGEADWDGQGGPGALDDIPLEEICYGAFRRHLADHSRFPSAFQFGRLLRGGYGLTGLGDDDVQRHLEECKQRHQAEQMEAGYLP